MKRIIKRGTTSRTYNNTHGLCNYDSVRGRKAVKNRKTLVSIVKSVSDFTNGNQNPRSFH